MTDIESTAIGVVAETVSAAPEKRAMCAALTRLAGNALAAIAGHEAAWKLHCELGRRHFERMGRMRRHG